MIFSFTIQTKTEKMWLSGSGSKATNDLMKLTELFPDAEWHQSIYSNPNINISPHYFIPKLDPDFENKFTYRNPNVIWSEYFMSTRSVSSFSANPNITWDIIKQHPDKDWDFFWLSQNPAITWDIVQNNPNPLGKEWNVFCLSCNPNITWEIVQNNPNPLGGEWSYGNLSNNPNITWEIVRANPDKDWNFAPLSANPNITWDIVQVNPNPLGKKWDLYYLAINPNIEWEHLESFVKPLGEEWDLSRFSLNPNLTWQIVRDHPEVKWDFSLISRNLFCYDKRALRHRRYGLTMLKLHSSLDSVLLYDLVKIVMEYFS